MGYYVNTTDCDFAIKRGNYEEAYRLLRALNARDELKRGRCYPASLARPEGSKSVARDPNVWFSWMPWNYDEVYGSAVEILRAVGFSAGGRGRHCFVSYDGKSGCEEEFMAALAPVVERGSYIEWAGEEPGDLYRYEFDGAKMRVFRGEVVWREVDWRRAGRARQLNRTGFTEGAKAPSSPCRGSSRRAARPSPCRGRAGCSPAARGCTQETFAVRRMRANGKAPAQTRVGKGGRMQEGSARGRRCAVRLSEREYAALRSAADASGCTMSDLMRSVAVSSALAGPGEGRRVIAYDRSEMSRLTYQVRALGLQYNQALRALNTLAKRDWVDPSAGTAALRDIAAVLASVDEDRAATLEEVRRMAEADRMLIGR